MDGITSSINAILKDLIKNFNTLLDCPVRFSGEYNEKKVHSFIEYIEYYKRVKFISDDQAVQELQYLLLDQAHDWWLRRKGNLNTWSEALSLLENQYSKKRPVNAVYTEILKHHYDDYDSKDDFIDDKMELLSELSQPELKENNKLEIIYALLPNDIKNKVKIGNSISIKELKEQLKLAKLDDVNMPSNAAVTTSISTTPEDKDASSKVSICQGKYNQFSAVTFSFEIEKNSDSDREPIIKVRRTEDLMPQDVKEEEEDNPKQQDEFLTNGTEHSSTNDILLSSHDNFEIDTDIMNQINSIIDESELNMCATNNNEVTPTNLSQASSTVEIKKVKKRCSYCRHFNHTAQICLKRAKHMKLFPERFMQTKSNENKNIFQELNNEELTQISPLNITNSNLNTTNTQPTATPLTTPVFLIQTPATSTPVADTSPSVTSSTVVLNNIPEKSINPILTTKLIAPINGKTTNKILAAKLRNINTPSPKCHQCGTLGFYKSICPNCSPIYNNNSHNQYSK